MFIKTKLNQFQLSELSEIQITQLNIIIMQVKDFGSTQLMEHTMIMASSILMMKLKHI